MTTDPTPKSDFSTGTVDVQNRTFEIRVLGFENGSFVSVTEGGSRRMGAMMVSLASGSKPVTTTTVIPARAESPFVRLAAERVSSTIRGIAVVSVSVQGEIDTDAAKAIMGKITEMIRNV